MTGRSPLAPAITPKEREFVWEFIQSGNAVQAYAKAFNLAATGQRDTEISGKARRLLQKPRIQAVVTELRQRVDKMMGRAEQDLLDRADTLSISKQRVSNVLASMAFGLEKDTFARDRHNAAVSLAKLHGWMVDRATVRVVTGPDDLSDEELDNLIDGIRRRIQERDSK